MIDDGDALAPLDECVDKVRADETCSACDQDAHGAPV